MFSHTNFVGYFMLPHSPVRFDLPASEFRRHGVWREKNDDLLPFDAIYMRDGQNGIGICLTVSVSPEKRRH